MEKPFHGGERHPTCLKDALEVHDLIEERSFIGGEWISGNGTFPVYDPVTNQVIANVANMEMDDFREAIDHAHEAFETFSRTKEYAEKAAKTMKKISMELGGNASFIVFEDADLDDAADALMGCKFRCSGQTCICANRVFVQRTAADTFISRLSDRICHDLKMRSGFDPSVTNGPLVNKAAVNKMHELINDAVLKGATVVARRGGNKTSETAAVKGLLAAGNFIFGPIASVVVFDREEDVVRLANNTEFGLASYFFSHDHRRIWRVAEALQVGMVGVNTGKISEAGSPFGGVKESGYGKEGSKYGLAEYQVIKSVTLGGLA
ncbi:hypothetical protein Z517_03654 [Fonsecaea pedrosoi CBS 271.37]|uniref:Succinate-semialdehyde dehydrogenase, mitochondrial n=1 Tax=Fonsecaea pedrosoi CBS 271.37 TaxID=1442368 RepID=A0A0D2HIZ0_9EURO|nr:uncharacterized protein Z517_03654 [Fonsecaea pedrosoi CBS 271.37]KIW84404.1 hypothetical protein Z517_03654 [Fonsecaea pedrosoi CBS 271.37]